MRYLPFLMLLLSGIAYADTVHIDPEPVDFDDPILPELDIAIAEPTSIQTIQSLIEGERGLSLLSIGHLLPKIGKR